ncbi:serine aminopeptidase domain-containing protein [Aeromonas sanarellii]
MSSEKVGFAGSSQGLLVGVLERPDHAPLQALAVFAHCFTCGKNSLAATRISRALAQQGIATLRFDFTGLGESEGDFGRGGFSSSVADIVAAVHWMQSTIGMPALLVGHSLGGDGGHRGGCPPRRHTGGLHAGRTRDGRPCASSLRSDQVRRGWADPGRPGRPGVQDRAGLH